MNQLQAYAAALLERQEVKEVLLCDNSFYGPFITAENDVRSLSYLMQLYGNKIICNAE